MSEFDHDAHRLAVIEETFNLYRRLNDDDNGAGFRKDLEGAAINNIVAARAVMEKVVKLSPETAKAVAALIGDRKVSKVAKEPVRFEDLEAMAKSIGVDDIYDILGHFAYSAKWHATHNETQPIDIKSKQEQYRRYLAAPDGSAAAPSPLNLWHWLLDFSNFSQMAKTTSSKHSMTIKIRTTDLPHQPNWVRPIMERLLEPYGGEMTLYMEVSR